MKPMAHRTDEPDELTWKDYIWAAAVASIILFALYWVYLLMWAVFG